MCSCAFCNDNSFDASKSINLDNSLASGIGGILDVVAITLACSTFPHNIVAAQATQYFVFTFGYCAAGFPILHRSHTYSKPFCKLNLR
jgi:hypothetical protein